MEAVSRRLFPGPRTGKKKVDGGLGGAWAFAGQVIQTHLGMCASAEGLPLSTGAEEVASGLGLWCESPIAENTCPDCCKL